MLAHNPQLCFSSDVNSAVDVCEGRLPQWWAERTPQRVQHIKAGVCMSACLCGDGSLTSNPIANQMEDFSSEDKPEYLTYDASVERRWIER